MRKVFGRGLAFVVLLSGLTVLPLQADESETKGAVPTRADANDPNSEVYRLTDVLNKPVKDDDGAEVGRIKDLVVDGRSREVLYAVVAMNDAKQKDAVYVMPWTVFRPYYGQNAFQYTVLTLPQSVWIQAPFYSWNQWGTIPFAQWGPRVNNYYSTHITQNTSNNSKTQNVRTNKPPLNDNDGDKPKASPSKSDGAGRNADKPSNNDGRKVAPKAKADPEPKAKSEPEPKAKAEPEPKTKTAPEPKAKTEPEPKTAEGNTPQPVIPPKAPVPKTADPVIPKNPTPAPSPREPKTTAPNPK